MNVKLVAEVGVTMSLGMSEAGRGKEGSFHKGIRGSTVQLTS